MTKPTMRPKVATSVLPLVCESGINSSTTTKNIAPAAKERAYGKMAVMDRTATAPSRAPTGSTMADPTMVQPHVNNPAIKACKTTDCD